MSSILLINLAAIVGASLFLWGWSLLRRSVNVVDVFWGPAFALISWLTFWQSPVSSTRGLLICALVTVWAIRLAAYLTWRNWGMPEDYRYRAMREKHGGHFPFRSLWTVFLLQGSLAWIIALPIQFGVATPSPIRAPAVVGTIVWSMGLFFETVGDYQLARFKANPDHRGMVMNRGLWRYTRHPNYFGDFLVWWGLFLVSFVGSAWWTILSPLIMSLLLLRVSGVKLLENSLQHRLRGYRRYVAETSAFVPWPPKPGGENPS